MLDTATQTIWDEANAMLLANILEAKKASLLQKTLRTRADVARDSGRCDHETKLRRAADELAARFLPPA